MDSQRGLLNEHVHDFAGMDAPDADLLPGNLDSALDTDDPVHAEPIRIGCWWWSGRSGAAQADVKLIEWSFEPNSLHALSWK